MGQKPRELQPYRSPADFFGAELRRLRVAHGLSLQRLSGVVHYDASLLAKVERAERAVSGDLAAACDAALGANGALIHLWEFVGQDRSSQAGLHVDAMGTSSAITASAVLTAQTIPLTAVVNGRVVTVEVDRRTLLQAMLSAGMSSVLGASRGSSTVQRPVDPAVIDHFARLRAVLVDADNLLGPLRLLSTVHQQLGIMDDLRRNTRGALRRDLLATQSGGRSSPAGCATTWAMSSPAPSGRTGPWR
jgi:transcriptional regulator with XRE-family HTH domain